MLFDDLTYLGSEFKRVGIATEKAGVPAWEQTISENQMNGGIWDWVIKKAWKIDMKVLQKKEFDRQSLKMMRD